MKNKWISYKELKNRWHNIFETDQEFLPLMHDIGLTAFKFDKPERASDLGGEDPFVSFTPQTAHDLQECWFMLEHIEMREHSYGESGPIYADQSPATWEKLAREKWANTQTEPFPGVDALRLDGELEVFHLPKSVRSLPETKEKSDATKQELQERTETERLYIKLGQALDKSYDITVSCNPIIVEDQIKLHDTVWAHDKVVKAVDKMTPNDVLSLKAGLRRYRIEIKLPKLTGGREHKLLETVPKP